MMPGFAGPDEEDYVDWNVLEIPPRGEYRRVDLTRQKRQMVLREEPDCRLCGKPSTEVDHIIPLWLEGSDNRSNLRGLCRACHRSETNRLLREKEKFRPKDLPPIRYPGRVAGGRA
jgi:5-methylcytosine-specific restriction endonuclease McrA